MHIVLKVKGEHLLTRARGGSLEYTYVRPHLCKQGFRGGKGDTIVMYPYGDETERPLNFVVEEVIGVTNEGTMTIDIRSTIATNPWLDYYKTYRDSPEFPYIRQQVLDYAHLSSDLYTLRLVEQDAP